MEVRKASNRKETSLKKVAIATVTVVAVLVALATLTAGTWDVPQSHFSKHSITTQNSSASAGATSLTPSVKQFAGETLHWRQESYSYDPSGSDPSNGQVLTADVWLRLGSDGIPTLYHARTFLPDGALHQDVTETSAGSEVMLGKDYVPLFANLANPQWCVTTPSTPSANMASTLPFYIDISAIDASGFQPVGTSTGKPIPTTPLLPGAMRVSSIAPSEQIGHWFNQAKVGTDTWTTAYDVASDGRVLVRETFLTDEHSAVLQHYWDAFGTIDVYETSSVPPTALQSGERPSGCVTQASPSGVVPAAAPSHCYNAQQQASAVPYSSEPASYGTNYATGCHDYADGSSNCYPTTYCWWVEGWGDVVNDTYAAISTMAAQATGWDKCDYNTSWTLRMQTTFSAYHNVYHVDTGRKYAIYNGNCIDLNHPRANHYYQVSNVSEWRDSSGYDIGPAPYKVLAW